MHTVNSDTIRKMGQRFAFVAIDQGTEFGTIESTISAYRENLIDTLADQGLSSWAWMAVEAFDAKVNKI